MTLREIKMNIKYLGITIMSLFVLSACGGGPHIYTGISAEQSKVYPLVMVANSDIVCGDKTFKKGAKFGVSDASGGKYKGIEANNMGEEQHFPKKSLYIRAIDNAYSASPLVYPDGQFVFQSGYLVTPVALNIGKDNNPDEILLWGVSAVSCTYKGTTPFSPIRN